METEDICPKCGSLYVRFKQEQRLEIAELSAEVARRDEKIAGLLESLDAHDGFIAQLRAEVERLTKLYEHDHQLCLDQASIVIEANTECNKLKAERDAAVVRGLEIAGPYLDGIIKSAKYCHTAIMNRIGDPKPDMILLENISIDHLEYVERIKIMIAAEIAKRKKTT